MYFLRISIILLVFLSITNDNFRIFNFKINAVESLQMSISGFFLVVLGSFGRIWASLYIEGNKTKNLIKSGPFSMVRNPLYVCSFLVLIGFCLAIKSLYLSICLIIIFIVFHVPSIINEEKELKNFHGENFTRYMIETPRLVPNIFNYKKPDSEEIVHVRINRINRTLMQVIAYMFLYTLIDILYFISN